MCAICGVLIVSLPIGIISVKFSAILQREHKSKIFLQNENQIVKEFKKMAHLNSCIHKDLYTRVNSRNLIVRV